MKKGKKVIVVLEGPGDLASTGGCICKVTKVTKKGIFVDDDNYSTMCFDSDGFEKDPSFPGMRARLISVEE